MGSLTNQFVKDTYQGLLKLTNSTTGITNTLQTIEDGLGNDTPLQMSNTQVNINGTFTVNGLPITGSTGGSGSSGTSGSSGSSGTSGVNGTSGTSGSSGSSGTSGTGVNGTSGSSGSSGTSGSSGSSGTSGTGVSGTDGSSGTSGSSGSSGTSGVNGTSGSSGSSGSSGTSGTSAAALAYGSFYNTANQNVNPNTDTICIFNSTFLSSGISRSATTGFTVTTTGFYSINYNVSVGSSANDDIYFWLRRNGTNILLSSRQGYSRTGGDNFQNLNWLLQLTANDIINIIFHIPNTTATLLYNTTPNSGPVVTPTLNVFQI